MRQAIKSEHIFTVNYIFPNLSQELSPVAKSSGFARFGRMPRGCQVCRALPNQLHSAPFLKLWKHLLSWAALNLPNMVVKAKGVKLLLENFIWSFALEKSLFCILLVNFDISVDQVCRKHANRRDNSNLLKPDLKVFLCLHFAWLTYLSKVKAEFSASAHMFVDHL